MGNKALQHNPTNKDEPKKTELAGRLYECVDIQRAIENGLFTSLDDVLVAVTARAAFIDSELKG